MAPVSVTRHHRVINLDFHISADKVQISHAMPTIEVSAEELEELDQIFLVAATCVAMEELTKASTGKKRDPVMAKVSKSVKKWQKKIETLKGG